MASEIEQIQNAKEEIKDLKEEIQKETDPVIKKGLLQRIEDLENNIGIVLIKWKGFQEQTAKEEAEKAERRKKHEEEVEQAKKRKANACFFDD